MSTLNKAQLLNDLRTHAADLMEQAADLRLIDEVMLNQQPATGQWSIAQVLEHLNTYNTYYLPLLAAAFENKSTLALATHFKPGLLGNYFVKLMQPDASGNIGKKMKAAKKHIPASVLNGKQVLACFMEGEQQFINLIEKAGSRDLESARIPTSITKLIRLKPGDVLRFLIAHQQRHFVQIAALCKLLQVGSVA